MSFRYASQPALIPQDRARSGFFRPPGRAVPAMPDALSVIRENIGCLADMRFPDVVQVMPKTPDMAKALAATAGAIGVTTMTVVEQSQGRVRPLALGGAAPTAQNVQNKTYALTRNSFLVMQTPPSSAVAAFMAFVRSPAGAKVIAANGAVPTQ